MQRKRVLAITGLTLAGAAALVALLYKPKEQPKTAQKAPLGRVTVVVSGLDNFQNLLDSDPNLVLVGTRAARLKANVAPKDEYRVIETETDAGWAHIVKHLRPDTVVLSQGLTGELLGGFVRRVLTMNDFINIYR